MKCAKVDCNWGDIAETSPCCVCGRLVHHLCSNELCTQPGIDLSKSRSCVSRFFNADSDSQELTPSSTSGISCSTVIDLAQAEDMEEEGAPNGIPDHIVHSPPKNATDPVWNLIHRLEKPATYKGMAYTHICLLCVRTKVWQESICRVGNASNAKSHLVSSHKKYDMAVQVHQHRLSRSDRHMVHVAPKAEVKRQASPSPTSPVVQPSKRQKTWWKAPVSRDQISGHIARWLIRDGLAHNMVTTPAFHDFLAGVTGDANATIPSSKTYNDILDNHFE
ncbi:hypothetical protein PR003_g30170, partial [Phytophthora rubi]